MGSYYHLLFSNQKSIKFYTKRSIYYHIGLIFIFAIFANINKFFSPTEQIKIIRSSVKVDVVAMPTKTLKELKTLKMGNGPVKMANIIQVDQIKKSGKAPNSDDFLKKKKKTNFKDMLRALAKKKIKNNKVKESIRKKSKKENTDKKLIFSKGQKNELQKLIYAGNKISRGSSHIPGEGTVDSTNYDLYISALPGLVRPNWRLPTYLHDKGLQCRIRIFLAATGHIVKSEIYESSGVKEYDQLALAAVLSSAPFPALSDDIKKRGRRGDILLGFPL